MSFLLFFYPILVSLYFLKSVNLEKKKKKLVKSARASTQILVIFALFIKKSVNLERKQKTYISFIFHTSFFLSFSSHIKALFVSLDLPQFCLETRKKSCFKMGSIWVFKFIN